MVLSVANYGNKYTDDNNKIHFYFGTKRNSFLYFCAIKTRTDLVNIMKICSSLLQSILEFHSWIRKSLKVAGNYKRNVLSKQRNR